VDLLIDVLSTNLPENSGNEKADSAINQAGSAIQLLLI